MKDFCLTVTQCVYKVVFVPFWIKPAWLDRLMLYIKQESEYVFLEMPYYSFKGFHLQYEPSGLWLRATVRIRKSETDYAMAGFGL